MLLEAAEILVRCYTAIENQHHGLWRVRDPGLISDPLSSSVTLCESQHLSEPQFSHGQTGADRGELELVNGKHLARAWDGEGAQ